jgi:hypothetical protein
MNEYTFYSDSGHAWLAVPLQEFLDSGAEVSTCSYVCTKRSMVFLEEDLDAYRFLKAKGFIGEGGLLTGKAEIKESHSNSSSWIRRLPSIATVTQTVSLRD